VGGLVRLPIALLSCLVSVALACADAPASHQVTVVGVDGATWKVIDELLARGELPTFRSLIDEGVRGRLRSELPLVSPAIWTSIATGVGRSRHGIRRFEVEDGQLVSSRHRTAPAVWNLASRAGLRSAVVGWWGTHPAEAIDGIVISERAIKARDEDLRRRFPEDLEPAALAGLTHPPGVLVDLAPQLLESAAAPDADYPTHVRSSARREDRGAAAALVAAREQHGPFALELILLRGTDPVSHLFWHYVEPDAPVYAAKLPRVEPEARAAHRDAVLDHYRVVDEILASLLRDSEDRNVFVISDHGFEPVVMDGRLGESLTGHHGRAALDGIFLARGPALRKGVVLRRPLSIYHVAPTLLYLLGLEVADDLVARVAKRVLRPEVLDALPLRRVATYSGPPTDLPAGAMDTEGEAERRLREELRALGYID
jgi:predicted AlkP superfamily phosphohydrolase/phosphomutase